MRSFIAIEVPFFKGIEELQSSIEGKFKAVEKENLHLTLKFLGEISERDVEKIKEEVEKCKTQPFRLKFKGVGFFPNENYIKVVWVGVENPEKIAEMMRCIDSHLAKFGFKREKSYVPHLTIARVKGKIKIENLEKFRDMEFGEIEVNEIKIKKSTLTPEGPIYEDVEVIPL